ncbi:hypothetical protein [Tenggerimyces flavus]|uniref:HTH iclR-type domain-containing protein n=1 Tax=Tenggerimyces flavus TaxID=1708749 RepID=A0ABV7Y9T6_9ACTN|nr:hypothetical protein [Tenggerimyces flavus]MBM7783658.1 hypothetical protein [Tenggerimyces flavus]
MNDTAAPQSEAEVLARGLAILTERLPPGWTTRPTPVPASRDSGVDSIVELASPDGTTTWLLIEAKRVVDSRDVASISELLHNYLSDIPDQLRIRVVIARYLSPPVRERLADHGLSYIDATGNIRLTASKPGLFLSDHGADRDPWRGPGRPRGTLKGTPAHKIVRALLDFDRQWSMRHLIETAEVSTGAAYRVVDFLADEDLIQKDEARIVASDWRRLLRRWSRDYEFVGSNRTTRWIAARGIDRLLRRAVESPTEYAVTGTTAAAEWAPYAPARAAMIYTSEATMAADLWDLRPADAGANVILAEPESNAVFARSRPSASGGYQIAAPTQVAVDLMTGPGRNPSEAEELVEWMVRNERAWRE